MNFSGWVINNLFLYCSCKPNPNIILCDTLFLYFYQYYESNPRIFLFPNKAYQLAYTLFSHNYYFYYF